MLEEKDKEGKRVNKPKWTEDRVYENPENKKLNNKNNNETIKWLQKHSK